MALMDEAVWRGKAFTDIRWVTIRSDIATYPF